jgi:integrase
MAQKTHITLFEAVERYLDQRRVNYAKTTYENDMSVLKRFAKATGDIQLRNLTHEHVDRWWLSIQKTVKEPASLNNYRKRLNLFFLYAARAGWMRGGDPLINIKVRKVMRRKRLQLPPDALIGLLDLAETPRDRAFLATAMNTALRASELVALRVGDVDLRSGRLAVTITKTAEEDEMPLTLGLQNELRRWLAIYSDDIGQPLQPSMALFPARTGPRFTYREHGGRSFRDTRPATWVPSRAMGGPSLVVQEALRKAGYPTKGEGVHTIRRSVARAYFDQETALGYDGALRSTQALLHHADGATTEGYLGLTHETKRRDQILQGKAFLTALVGTQDADVVAMPARGESSATS